MEKNISFSIIIPNYNYELYVKEAIESALEQDWPNKEVIVVDDGSIDGSRKVIEAFGDRIISVFTENRGQREANNTGFSRSSGDIIIFLDSDDILLPGMLKEVAAVWREGLSKVQVIMQRVDADKSPIGRTIPKYDFSPTPAQIRSWVEASFEYPSPPASGNAWSRTFLEAFFPLDETYDAFTDSTCIAMAPYMGDIITIAKPLVLYRMHGANDSHMTARETNYSREVARGLKRLEAAQQACFLKNLQPPDINILFRGSNFLQFRVASLRLTPELHPLPGDSRMRAFVDSIMLPFRSGFQKITDRFLITAWSVLTLLVPDRLARFLIRKRYSS